ncbi:MAG: hypothetical protein ACI97N_001533 [Cognaticolwellia sp.]|jgi:hypothetical protein
MNNIAKLLIIFINQLSKVLIKTVIPTKTESSQASEL